MIYKFKKLPLIFVINSKCASSNILNIINQIEHLFVSDNPMDVHNNNDKYIVNCLHNNKYVLKRYSNHKIIFFVRNPYDRLISGYSKVTNKLILKMRFINNKSIEECNNLVKNGDITFPDWCDLITSIDRKCIDQHFVPQTYHYKNILNCPNTTIYDIDNLDNFKECLKNEFKIDVKINIEKKYSYHKPTIPDDKKEKIYQYYKDDFNLLGYKK